MLSLKKKPKKTEQSFFVHNTVSEENRADRPQTDEAKHAIKQDE